MLSQIGPRKLLGRRKLFVLLVVVTSVVVVVAVLIEVIDDEVSDEGFALDVRNIESEGRAI